MSEKKKIIVIGGGAAGLMAAGQAAHLGAETILLEKMAQPARKLRITGKGRCNITNIAPIADFISHFGNNGKFLRQAFSKYFNKDLIDFLNKAGLETVTERGGRVFPASSEANDVVKILTEFCSSGNVVIKTGSNVKKLLTNNNRITGVISREKQTDVEYSADAVILAAGGASYPGTGSTGEGYALAESAGHSIIPCRPALVPLETAGDTAGHLEGLSLKNVTASIWIDGRKSADNFGDMLFTANGVSGPIILSLSKLCVDMLAKKSVVVLSIDLKPALDHDILDKRLLNDIKEFSGKAVKNMLKGLMPERLIQVCLLSTGIQPDKNSGQINAEERKKLRLWLKDFRLNITGHRPFAEAIITAGGISTKEINPRTMESLLVKGLYICGEVIDIDADTGGYNLQAAFSTGWLAGISAAGASHE